MRLAVEGTERPVSVRLTNATPEVISLEGGDEQVVTTSGGADNRVVRTVRAVGRGDFDLRWELDLPSCPCGEPDDEDVNLAPGTPQRSQPAREPTTNAPTTR